MKKFKELMEGADTIVFAFGRFNPPTTGHEKLIKKVASVAGSNPFHIYPSHTTNPKKDPLPHALKVAYMRKMFKKYARKIIADKGARTAIEIATKLYKEGFKNLIMVVGSDRLKEFSVLLNRYNDAPDKKGNQLFKFDSVEVISAGERDPDSEGVEGMSASKMRDAAIEGDFDSFSQGLPSDFKDAKNIYRDVRKYMGIREERDMGNMTDFETVRDAYLTGKIWNAGDIVEANGVSGEVVRKGTNYLSFADEKGKVHKAWLHEITLNEAKSSLQKLRDFDKSRVAAGKKPIFKDKNIKFVKMKKKGQMTIMNVPADEFDKWTKKGYEIVEGIELDERNYRKEYDNYQGRPEQIARRSSRNKARRILGDKTKIGMDVGHRDNDPLNNDPKNLRNEDPSKNRREPRLREKRDAGYPDDSVKIGKKHWIIYKDAPSQAWWGYEVDKKGNQVGDAINAYRKNELMRTLAKEDVELDEMAWYLRAIQKIHQMTHPKGYEKLSLKYADEMKKALKALKKGQGVDSGKIIHDVIRPYEGSLTSRSFIDYINKLVKKGILPQELKAEYEPVKENKIFSFREFVDQIQEKEEEINLNEIKELSPEIIKRLQASFKKIRRFNPRSPSGKKILQFISDRTDDELKNIIKANINHLSKLAKKELKHRKSRGGQSFEWPL